MLNSVVFIADGLQVMYNGQQPEVRVPVVGGGTNVVVPFSYKANFENAMKAAKRVVKENKIDWVSVRGRDNRGEIKMRKTPSKTKKTKRKVK
jgi:hypothetical protein